MDSPLLIKNEHNDDDDVTIHGDSSSNNEHIVNMTIHGDSSTYDEQIVDITTHGDSSTNDEHIVDNTTHGDSSPADEQPSHEAFQWSCPFIYRVVWILVELAMTLVQISAAIFLQNQEVKTVWITCYKWASIAALPFVCLRLWEITSCLEKCLEYFFDFLVVIFLMDFLSESGSRGDTTQYFWLWFGLIVFSCIRYILPNLACAVLCLAWPVAFALYHLKEAILSLVEKCLQPFKHIFGGTVCCYCD